MRTRPPLVTSTFRQRIRPPCSTQVPELLEIAKVAVVPGLSVLLPMPLKVMVAAVGFTCALLLPAFHAWILDGVVALADALQACSKLEVLSLVGMRVDDRAAGAGRADC